ncbi:hypothetical protein [Bacillus thuringiensis]|uniref:hypothetical protein n=1 Tax=Bacillus thuringiensis TaxID=1428 RepID=UPI0026E3D20D|nr:hypothetical protein [Bacillus thuringiensis]MDO6630076.1 hypothetical protein [Bacillus thuringiensis]MDO6700125.1 hypothetical protein [Bacillus thuringiensis]
MNSTINKIKLPATLKDYFLTSNRMESLLSEEILLDIEEIYILYKSLYAFDESDFSLNVIKSINMCRDRTGFYFYLKKVLDRELEKKSKGNKNNIVISQNLIEEQYKIVTKEYIDSINQMYCGETIRDLKHVYKNIGNLEMLNNLVEDEYLKDLLFSGYEILRGFEEKIK